MAKKVFYQVREFIEWHNSDPYHGSNGMYTDKAKALARMERESKKWVNMMCKDDNWWKPENFERINKKRTDYIGYETPAEDYYHTWIEEIKLTA